MNAWELPTTLNVGGKDYAIRTDFRAVLDILMAHNDPELDKSEKAEVMLRILFPDFDSIPPECWDEAATKAADFIDCGRKPDGKKSPRLVDWGQDAAIIIPAVNSVAKCEVRAIPELHWWTFFGWYMSISESLFSSVLRIRQKKSKHKKLDKFEEEFYRDNRSMIDLKEPETEEIRAEKESILKWL